MQKETMEALYKEHGKIVYGYLLKLTHNSDLAEELSQETFYQALLSFDRYEGNGKVSSWLCQIAKHIWCNYKRKEQRLEYIEDIETICSNVADTFVEDLIEGEQKFLFYELLHSLPSDMREVIYLKITGEFTFREIGEILGKSEVWARTNFYRGKQKIMEEVKKSERI